MIAGNVGGEIALLTAYTTVFTIALVGGLSYALVPRSRWGDSLRTLGLGLKGAGVYRGRAIQVTRQGSLVTIAIRTRNSACLYDEFSSDRPVPALPWISELASMQLSTLSFARQVWDRWDIRLKDQTLEISCATLRPERLRFLLDLACDLADGVDRFGEERPPLTLRHRAL